MKQWELIAKVDESNYAHLLQVYPDVRVRLTRVFQDMWLHKKCLMRITSSFRTFEEQQKIVLSKVIAAPSGRSYHHYGLAVDICFVGNDPYLEHMPEEEAKELWEFLGNMVEGHGLVWGGHFSKVDKPHIQCPNWLSLDEIVAAYKHGGGKAVYATIDKKRGINVGAEWNSMVSLVRIPDPGKLDL